MNQRLHPHPQEPPFAWEIKGAARPLETFIVRRCLVCGRQLIWMAGKGWCDA